MLFGLFGKKALVEVRTLMEVNFKIDHRMSEKEMQNKLNKIVFEIQDQFESEQGTKLSATVKKSYIASIGAKIKGKGCNSFVAWVSFSTMSKGKEKADDTINRINFVLNDINDNTNKYNIEYMN